MLAPIILMAEHTSILSLEVVVDATETCQGIANNDMGEALLDIKGCNIHHLYYIRYNFRDINSLIYPIILTLLDPPGEGPDSKACATTESKGQE